MRGKVEEGGASGFQARSKAGGCSGEDHGRLEGFHESPRTHLHFAERFLRCVTHLACLPHTERKREREREEEGKIA